MIDIKTVNERIENLDKKTSSNINLIIKEYKKLKEEVSYDEGLLNHNVLLQKCFFHINVNLIKNYDERLDYIDKYKHLFYDWYCTDLLISLVKKSSIKKMIEYTKLYRFSKDEFTVRWAFVMYITHVNKKDKILINELLPLLVNDERYMVIMGEAWLLCELAIYHPNEIYDFLKRSNLNYKIKSKAISKIYDSFRINNEIKAKFLDLRSKLKIN